jgi:hypothetical protein
MAEGYFTPWRDAPDRACRTCAASIGTPDGGHLWCERHRIVVALRGARRRSAQTMMDQVARSEHE